MTEAAPKPTWEPLWLGCKACGHNWDDWQPFKVPINVWVANLRAQTCPNCGAGVKKLVIRFKPIDEACLPSSAPTPP